MSPFLESYTRNCAIIGDKKSSVNPELRKCPWHTNLPMHAKLCCSSPYILAQEMCTTFQISCLQEMHMKIHLSYHRKITFNIRFPMYRKCVWNPICPVYKKCPWNFICPVYRKCAGNCALYWYQKMSRKSENFLPLGNVHEIGNFLEISRD